MDKDCRRKIMRKAWVKYKIDMLLFMISWKEIFPFPIQLFLSFIISISNLFEWRRKAKDILT
jgi:hypothetical protein